MKTQPLLTMTVSGNTPAEVITNAKKNIKALEDSLKKKTARAASHDEDEEELDEEEEDQDEDSEESEDEDSDEENDEDEDSEEDEDSDEENEEEEEEEEVRPPKKKAKTNTATSSGKTNPAKKALFAAAAKHTKFHKSRKKTLSVLSKFNCKSINEVPKEKYEAVTRALTKDMKK